MKLIFFDIDGTLIDERKQMPESAAKAICRARENGHLCLVNTGRTASLVLDWLPALAPFDGYLCGCGTQLFFREKELLHVTFTPEQARDIIDGLEKYKIDAILEGAETNFHNALEKMHTEVFRNYIIRHYPDRNWAHYLDGIGRFDKFYCFADRPGAVRAFVEERSELLDLIDRGEGYYEIVPKGYSKASAIDYLVDHLNRTGEYKEKITLRNTVAIGDSNNDLPMLEHAHTAIAMGDSSDLVLKIADFVTASVMEDGIEKALDWLGVLNFPKK